MMIPIILLLTFVAGLVHGTVGFGGGIVIMMVLPMFYELPQAAGISSVIVIALNVQMVLVYWKKVNWRNVPFPAVIYLLFSSLAINYSKVVNETLLRVIFGMFLIGLCLYYLLQKNSEKGSLGLAGSLFAMSFSGTCSGLFGIGGPLMSVYFLGHSKDNIEYLATIQGFFLVAAIYSSFFRAAEGILQMEHLLPIAVGAAGILCGGLAAKKIVSRMNPKVFLKCIYAMLGISGVLNIYSALA